MMKMMTKLMIRHHLVLSKRSYYYMKIYTLHTLILARKKFHPLSGKLANFILATLIALHNNIYKNRVKLPAFKISYLK